MPNTHQEHPEDLVLTGDTWVLDAIDSGAEASLKIDGCPAVVFGTNPANGRFFVGTKSVFNKQRIKICYSYEDIVKHYGKVEELCSILLVCFSYLPRVEGVYQGDFIGFGGQQEYTPNALTYKFDEVVTSHIIFAPHTEYTVTGHMSQAVAKPISVNFNDGWQWLTNSNVTFVKPIVDRRRGSKLFADLDLTDINWLTTKEAAKVKVAINAVIRSGQSLDLDTLTTLIGDVKLAELYWFVMNSKKELMAQYIVYDAPECYLNGERTIGEGFVINTDRGMVKLVDREVFSRANFNTGYQK